MPQPTHGATYGDAIIHAIDWARSDPWTFFPSLVLIIIAGLIALVIFRIVFVGPNLRHRAEFIAERLSHRKRSDPPEPLE